MQIASEEKIDRLNDAVDKLTSNDIYGIERLELEIRLRAG